MSQSLTLCPLETLARWTHRQLGWGESPDWVLGAQGPLLVPDALLAVLTPLLDPLPWKVSMGIAGGQLVSQGLSCQHWGLKWVFLSFFF